jgi:hypothetical protein
MKDLAYKIIGLDTLHTSPLSPVGLHYPTDHNPPIVPFPKPVVRWDIFDIADELADLPGAR